MFEAHSQRSTSREAGLSRRHFLGQSAAATVATVATAAVGLGVQSNGVSAFQATPAAESESGYVSLGELDMYYERHGAGGQPLVLLHGGLITIDLAFGMMIPALAATREVIAVELQGHGHTADVDRPMSYEQMADDTVALLEEIGVTNADIFGFSLGGGVALQIAIRHPEVVRKLVVASTPFRHDGWHPAILGSMSALNPEAAAAMEATPLYAAYAAVAPRPEDWPRLVTKTGQLTTSEYDWGDDVASITAPVLLIYGDADSVLPQHILELFELLGGAVVTETVFSWPGVGRMAVQAIYTRDFPLVQVTILMTAVLFVMGAMAMLGLLVRPGPIFRRVGYVAAGVLTAGAVAIVVANLADMQFPRWLLTSTTVEDVLGGEVAARPALNEGVVLLGGGGALLLLTSRTVAAHVVGQLIAIAAERTQSTPPTPARFVFDRLTVLK